MEAIFTFLSEYSPSIGLIIIICVAMYYVTMYHVSIQNTKKKVEEQPCDNHREQLSNISGSVQDIRKKVDELSCDGHMELLVNIFNSVQIIHKKLDALPCDNHRKAIINIEENLFGKKKFKGLLSAIYSPRKLSDPGRELYQISGIQNVFEDNMQFFVEELEKIHPKTALDVEDSAFSVLLNSKSEDIFIPVKDWLYNNPLFHELDIDMSAICFVASLELRDVYLKKHPEILPENR